MLFDNLDEILDNIAYILECIIRLLCFIGLFITSPIWYIPYLICKAFENKEERDNGSEV